MRAKIVITFYALILTLPGLLGVAFYQSGDKNTKLSRFMRDEFFLSKKVQFFNAYLQLNILKNKNLGNIHMGRDGWMFYMTRTDGNVYNDFLAVPNTHTADLWVEYVEKSRKRPYCYPAQFLFFSPPNKETLYREKTNLLFQEMIPQENSNFSLIHKKIKVRFPENLAEMLPALSDKKNQINTYHVLDTHWNPWGAYWAHREILEKANHLLNTNFAPIKIESLEKQGLELAGTALLLESLGFSFQPPPLVQVVLENPDPVEILTAEEHYAVYGNKRGEKIVWLVGDSFRKDLELFLPKYFAKTVFFFRYDHLSQAMERARRELGPPDLIIDEIVERYLAKEPVYGPCPEESR